MVGRVSLHFQVFKPCNNQLADKGPLLSCQAQNTLLALALVLVGMAIFRSVFLFFLEVCCPIRVAAYRRPEEIQLIRDLNED